MRRVWVAAVSGMVIGSALFRLDPLAQSIFLGVLPTNCTTTQVAISSGNNLWACGAQTGGAPTTATYITQTANASLSAEQALASLSSGIMRVATTTGAVTSLGDVLPMANGGLAVALADPNADRLLFWDDSAGAYAYLTAGTGLSITTTTMTASGTPGGSDTQVQFNNAGVFGGDSGLVYIAATDSVDLAGTLAVGSGATYDATTGIGYVETFTTTAGGRWGEYIGVTINPSATSAGIVLGFQGEVQTQTGNAQTITGELVGMSGTAAHKGTGAVDRVNGMYGESSHQGSNTMAFGSGAYGALFNESNGTIVSANGGYFAIDNASTGTITSAYTLYANAPSNGGGGTITTAYGLWIGNQTIAGGTTDYMLWYDGGGGNCNTAAVYRINHFGIAAYYNPCFTAYVPDAANFERIIQRWGDTGVFGVDNRAYFGTEEGGTGAERPLTLTAGNVSIQSLTLTPAVSNTSANSCGTTAAAIAGNDNVGKVTVGATSGTSCTVTFATAFSNAPSCSVSNETTANLSRATSTTTTAILAGVFVAGDVLAYACMGR